MDSDFIKPNKNLEKDYFPFLPLAERNTYRAWQQPSQDQTTGPTGNHTVELQRYYLAYSHRKAGQLFPHQDSPHPKPTIAAGALLVPL